MAGVLFGWLEATLEAVVKHKQVATRDWLTGKPRGERACQTNHSREQQQQQQPHAAPSIIITGPATQVPLAVCGSRRAS